MSIPCMKSPSGLNDGCSKHGKGELVNALFSDHACDYILSFAFLLKKLVFRLPHGFFPIFFLSFMGTVFQSQPIIKYVLLRDGSRFVHRVECKRGNEITGLHGCVFFQSPLGKQMLSSGCGNQAGCWITSQEKHKCCRSPTGPLFRAWYLFVCFSFDGFSIVFIFSCADSGNKEFCVASEMVEEGLLASLGNILHSDADGAVKVSLA